MLKLLPCVVVALTGALAIPTECRSQTIPFDSSRWQIEARDSKVVEHLGRSSLYLQGGMALVKDSRFTDGSIEFDISFTQERGFQGAVWRVQDTSNYEEFYFRPHQSGNPDANQYQPVFNGVVAWQLYYGEPYSAPVRYDFDQWVHVKILVTGKQAEIYIKDMERPALDVELKRDVNVGQVGLSVGNFAPAYYSNFSYSRASPPPFKGTPKPADAAPPGSVMSWAVSTAFDGKSLQRRFRLDIADTQSLRWRSLAADSTGVANLARLQGVADGTDTAFAKATIRSDSAQVKRLRFGFSDAVKIYLNGRLLFGGNDLYRSRDYRFLGTLGLYYDLYLPLEKGDNELLFAVTENFGGWGVKAAFDDMNGISLATK